MPWLAKALLLALKTKRGRELLLAGGLGAVEIARSERARKVYAKTWQVAADPRPRRKAAGVARRLRGRANPLDTVRHVAGRGAAWLAR